MKHINIETCEDCPYRNDSTIALASYCRKMKNKEIFHYDDPFPEWCPLPNNTPIDSHTNEEIRCFGKFSKDDVYCKEC